MFQPKGLGIMLSPRTFSPLARTATFLSIGLAMMAASQVARAAETVTFEIVADDMCCAGCAKTVAAKLYTAPGVINVKANVATRTLVVTAKPSPKLTLEKLWSAVEKGKGKPSRLVAFGTAYTLTRPADLSAEEQPAAGVYTLSIAGLQPGESAERIAKVLYGIRGVSKVTIDAPHSALFVEPARGVVLSPWMLMAVIEQAQAQPLAISGPHGRLAILSAEDAAQISSRPVIEGENR
jgi:copper chaperone CopZ